MKILAIDTSTDYLSLAVMDGKDIIGSIHRKAAMNHSSLLIPMIDRLLKRIKLKLKDVDAFSISIGPGSFTGLRIGVAAVKGLACSLRKPIVAVPTLDIIAHNARDFVGIACPVLDAKKNKVYSCLYKSDGKSLKRISKYLLLSIGDLVIKLKEFKDNILFLGDALEKFHFASSNRQTIRDWHPKAEIVARLGLENFKKKRFVSPEDLEPLYLYSKECDIKGI